MKNTVVIIFVFLSSVCFGQMSHFMGIGGVTTTSAIYKARTVSAGQVIQLRYSTNSNLAGASLSSGVSTLAADDNTGGENIGGLSPNTEYYYSVVVNGIDAMTSPFPSFSTFGKQSTKVVFGSCQSDPFGGIFPTMANENGDIFIHLGDLGYPDDSGIVPQRNNYKAQHNLNADYIKVIQKMPVERVWDDHDFGENDSNGANPLRDSSLKVWNEYTPHYSLANPSSGTWRKWKMGSDCSSVEFFMTDQRFQRSEMNGERFPTSGTTTATISGSTISFSGNTAVGHYDGFLFDIGGEVRRLQGWNGSSGTFDKVPALQGVQAVFATYRQILDGFNIGSGNQLDWLINGVNSSSCTFQVILSSSPVNMQLSPTETAYSDTWDGMDGENLEWRYIYQEITKTNVIVLSADRHYVGHASAANSLFPEFNASPFKRGNLQGGVGWDLFYFRNGYAYGVVEFTEDCELNIEAKNASGTIYSANIYKIKEDDDKKNCHCRKYESKFQ